jgi:hypothetical protein
MVQDRASGKNLITTTSQRGAILGFILLLGLLLFLKNIRFEFASDDLAWLNGDTPTIFIQYRLIPRLFFGALKKFFGPNPIAALALIFVLHLTNTILLYKLTRLIFSDWRVGLLSAAVFMINPVTLGTLTWISCFSYILGTFMALTALLTFWQSGNKSNPFLFSALAISIYGLGLFYSHEIFFLPLLFPLLGWLQRCLSLRRSAVVSSIAIFIGFCVNFMFYNFDNYGSESANLISVPFFMAYVSSIFSYGFTLLIAYPVLFFTPVTGLLKFCFSEVLRWIITITFLTSIILLIKRNSTWKRFSIFTLSFTVLITPYIIRIALMPESVNYHISYLLTGRVFYLPFTILAILWGWLLVSIFSNIRLPNSIKTWVFGVVTLGVYIFALLFTYDSNDFIGLSVASVPIQNLPPPWNPYKSYHPVWLIPVILILSGAIFFRQFLNHKENVAKFFRQNKYLGRLTLMTTPEAVGWMS